MILNNNLYPWTRYWRDIEVNINYDREGFIQNPDQDTLLSDYEGIYSFSETNKHPLVILLGKPGSGKTTTVQKNVGELKQDKEKKGEIYIYKDLSRYGEESRLIEEVFHSNRVQNWKEGEKELHYFLDSLDECMFNIPNLPKILEKQLHKLKDNNTHLNIRIVSRTAKWPDYLSNNLSNIWGIEEPAIYELIRLSKNDIKSAANAENLNSQKFIEEIKEKEIQPLASSPITLQFLLDIFQQQKTLPDSKQELYNKGCKILCEVNKRKREQYEKGYMSKNKRFTLASRIAAFMVFCNKSYVTLYSIKSTNEEALDISDIEGRQEQTENHEFEFDENDLKEVIQETALFNAYGKGKYCFAHHSYLEYLAAKYLMLRNFSKKRIKALILAKSNRVVPYLSDIISWISSLDSEIRNIIIKNDPKVLLYGDLSKLSENDKEKILKSFLDDLENGNILDDDYNLYFKYPKLNYVGIENTLINYINDKQKSYPPRRAAIDISKACQVEELNDNLLEIFLDTAENLQIRKKALQAIVKNGNEEIYRELKNYLLGDDFSEDTSDTIRGNLLDGLWPEYLSTKEVFNYITPPKQKYLIGSYAMFLRKFGENIKIENLHIALRYIVNNPVEQKSSISRLKNMKEIIIYRAWHNLKETKIFNSLIKVIKNRLKNYKEICPKPYSKKSDNYPEIEENIRKKIILRLIESDCKHPESLIRSKPQLIFNNDLEWLINYYLKHCGNFDDNFCLDLIDYVFDRYDQNQFQLLYNNMSKCEKLEERFKKVSESVKLNSDQAERQKRMHKQIEESEKEEKAGQEDENIKKSVIFNKLQKHLEKYDSGEISHWYKLCADLSLNKKGIYHYKIENDITNFYFWKRCSNSEKKKILNWAKEYIKNHETSPEKWVDNKKYFWPDMSGYKAFILLSQIDSDFLDQLSKSVWINWAPVIIGFPESVGVPDSDKQYLKLINQAFLKAPESILDTLSQIIDREDDLENKLFILKKVENIESDKLNKFLLNKIQKYSLLPNSFYNILSFLLNNNYSKAVKYAKKIIKSYLKADNDKIEYVKYAALSLMNNTDIAGWNYIWPIIKNEKIFRKKLLSSYVSENSLFGKNDNIFNKLENINIAKWYILIYKDFPPKEDPDINKFHSVTIREEIANFRSSMVKYLEDEGDVISLKYIKKHVSSHNSIDYHLINARKIRRDMEWDSLSIDEFLELIEDADAKLINNEELLLEAIINSLDNLEKKLQGETPLARNMWDKIDKQKFKPKNENHLSDYIKVHLEEELNSNNIVALREVEIRRKMGKTGRKGEKTDIYVTGYNRNQEKLTIIIEIKGCWNREVEEAIETQLFDRYLDKEEYKCGLYIIGWFCCSQWEEDDNRKNEISTGNLEEAREMFDKKARELSTDTKKIKSYIMDCSLE